MLAMVRHGLTALPDAIRAARRAMRLSRQNIALSVAYNVVAVPAAVLGFVTPLLAALAMAASSVGVTLNALRAAKPTAYMYPRRAIKPVSCPG
jgi:P-type Cu2+ transporter